MDLKQINDNLWEIPKSDGMRVPGRIYANQNLIEAIIKDDSIKQVQNVAHLPGIVKYSLAMPDIHQGYGFPIGGVCATDPQQDGVVSPGGVDRSHSETFSRRPAQRDAERSPVGCRAGHGIA